VQQSELVRFPTQHYLELCFEHTTILAQQNEQALRNLRLGMFIPTLLSTFFRLLFRRSSLPPSKGSLAIYIVTFLPALFLSRYLERMGTPRRDPTTGALISPGEDLNQPGVTEWCFDILYVTCELVPTLAGQLNTSYLCRGMPNRQWGFWGMVLVVLPHCKCPLII
jgi:hypothetical protein